VPKLPLIFLITFLVNSPAMAGLFTDEDARKQVLQLETRIIKFEEALVRSDEDNRVRVRALLDIQMQLEAQAAELRKLRGQNEELVHTLQDLEKRQKDFYVDLDARVRRFESDVSTPSHVSPQSTNLVDGTKDVAENPLVENKAFEAAYGFYKAESYQNAATAFRDFLRQFPQSVHEANVYYWLGNAYFLANDYSNSLDGYQNLLTKYPDHPRVPEAMLNIAECQFQLKNKAAVKKTLKQIVVQFPGSDAADKAKKRLATLK
jgi:tol-pal system protein YbgF